MFARLITISTAAVVAAAGPMPRSASSTTGAYSSIVVFGDSFSDNGNGAFRLSNGTWPLVPPYYQKGTFSNGPVWPDYLAANLSLPLYDYAVGGATTSNALVQGSTGPSTAAPIPVPAVDDQVAAFLAGRSPQNTSLAGSGDFARPLFVLMGGANDILFDATVSAAESYGAIAAAAASLRGVYGKGVATVVTVGYPDLAKLPYGFYVQDDVDIAAAAVVAVAGKRALSAYTDLLAVLLADGAARGGGAVDESVDLRALFEEWEYYARPQAYGFAPLGKYGSCLVGVYGEGAAGANGTIAQCADAEAEGWVYWDEYHPTTRVHSWIAKEILKAVS